MSLRSLAVRSCQGRRRERVGQRRRREISRGVASGARSEIVLCEEMELKDRHVLHCNQGTADSKYGSPREAICTSQVDRCPRHGFALLHYTPLRRRATLADRHRNHDYAWRIACAGSFVASMLGRQRAIMPMVRRCSQEMSPRNSHARTPAQSDRVASLIQYLCTS